MKKTIDETNRRREKQLAYNEANGITPKQIQKAFNTTLLGTVASEEEKKVTKAYIEPTQTNIAADPIIQYMTKPQMEKAIEYWNLILLDAPQEKLDVVRNLRKNYHVHLLSNTNQPHWEYICKNCFGKDGHTIDDYFEKKLEKIWGKVNYKYYVDSLNEYAAIIHENNLLMLQVQETDKEETKKINN